jgi:cytochrome c oxidase assembly protein subunit 15
MHRATGSSARTLAALALAILLATLLINALSAFIRHEEAGLGCADRAACYGRVAPPEAAGKVLVRQALAPDAPAKRTHRALATALVVMVLVLLHRTRAARELRGFEARAPLLILGLLVLLAVIGPASYLKSRPAIAACNLLGGIALAAVSYRLWLGLSPVPGAIAASAGLRRWLHAALLLLLLALALGAWTSANYAGLACTDLAQCANAVVAATPGELLGAFWYFRELGQDATGRLDAGAAAAAIPLAHRGVALATAVTLLVALWRAWREQVAVGSWLPVAVLLCAQLALGLLQPGYTLPLGLVLAHGTNATLLLLALLRLRFALHTTETST